MARHFREVNKVKCEKAGVSILFRVNLMQIQTMYLLVDVNTQ